MHSPLPGRMITRSRVRPSWRIISSYSAQLSCFTHRKSPPNPARRNDRTVYANPPVVFPLRVAPRRSVPLVAESSVQKSPGARRSKGKSRGHGPRPENQLMWMSPYGTKLTSTGEYDFSSPLASVMSFRQNNSTRTACAEPM